MWNQRLKWTMSFFALIILYELGWKLRQKWKKYPPGPSNIGMMYWVIKSCILYGGYDPSFVVPALLHNYGHDGIVYHGFPVIFLKICIIYHSKIAKQVLNNKNALYRPILGDKKSELRIENTADGTAPFASINGKDWEKRRKLAQSILFRFCNQSRFLNKILEEEMLNVVFPQLNKFANQKQLWYPATLMKHCAFNTIFYANYGRHIKINDPIYNGMVEVITETFQLFESGIVYGVMPKILLFFVKLNPYTDYYKILELIKKRDRLSKQITNRTKQIRNQNKNTETVSYVDYIENTLTESEVEADMAALFGAGMDTTSSSLNFAIVLAAKNAEIQRKIRMELMKCYEENMDKVEDNGAGYKIFNVNWVTKLQYFRAFIYEVLRVSSITKGGLPHYSTDDIYVDIDGGKRYYIPKGTVVGYHIEGMHKNTNKEHWIDSSDKMCLENWLNVKTNKFEINESFLTFGTGRRDCVGRSLAIKELYIIMAMLILNYEISFPNEKDREKPIQTLFNGVNVIHPPIGVVVNRLNS
eukprot:211530_1